MFPQIHSLAQLQLVARKKLGSPIGLHFGVYVGQAHLGLPDLVIDLSGPGCFVKAPVAFLSGEEWWYVEDALPADNCAAVERLLHKIRQVEKYDLIVNNCEDWAREVIHGRRQSKQRNVVLTTIVVLAVAAKLRG